MVVRQPMNVCEAPGCDRQYGHPGEHRPFRPVTDGGPWRGPTEAEWVERIARLSTPAGESVPWIKREERKEVVVEDQASGGDGGRTGGAP